MSDEWLTVAQAAARLQVDPRQVRRYLPRLKPEDTAEDTQRTHKGQPITLVRLSAVEALRGGDHEREAPRDNGQDTPRDRNGRAVKLSVDALTAALLAEKDARISELTEALSLEREAHRRAELLHLNTQGELSDLRERADRLQAANRRLLESGPQEVTDKGQDTPADAAPLTMGEPAGVSSGPGGPEPVPAPADATEGKWAGMGDVSRAEREDPPRRWWQVWRKGGGGQ